MRAELEAIAEKPEYATADYTARINEAMREVADQVIMPDLKRVGIITTEPSVAYVSLSGLTGDEFSGTVRRVRRVGVTAADDVISIFTNLEELLDYYNPWNETGDIEAVAVEGNNLWYQKVPDETDSLTLLYTAYPTVLVGDDDEPTNFPSSLHRELFIHGAAKLIWDTIEVDMENPKVYKLSYESSQSNGLTKLREWIGRHSRHRMTSFWRY